MAENWTPVPGFDVKPYSDELVFDFDHKTKAISPIKNQVLVTGEKNSQYIRFRSDRYFDGIDLVGKEIQIIYLAPGEVADINSAVNAEYTDDKIQFGWIVPAGACYETGTMGFSIEFVDDDYVLKSKKYEIKVQEGLNGAAVVPEPTDEVWYIELQERCARTLAKAEEAAAALDEILAAKEAVENEIEAFGGTPLTARTASAMTDTSKVYVYTGSETGFTAGHWYYFDGTIWTDGGVYNAVAVVTDPTLSKEGQAADALAVKEALEEIEIKADDFGLTQDSETLEVFLTYKGVQSENRATIDFPNVTRNKVAPDVEEVLGKAESAMQPSVYDPLGYGKRETPVDPYSYATTETSKAKTAIKDTETYTVTDNGVTEQEATKYTGLNSALSGVLERAERFANALLSDYSPINILIVEQLPETGADRTFYLIPKESGTGYDKWWYITDERGNKKWDKFGSSSTLIVTELPQEADSDVDYILDADGEYQYCKYIDGAWHVIAGSNAKIIEYPDNHLPEKTYFGKGTTPDQSIAYLDSYSWYLDTETMTIYAISYNAGTGRYSFTDPIVLVAEPSESKDYYILDAAQTYEHFRVIGSKFEQIGSSAYTRAEVDEKVRAINSEISDNAGRIGANAQNINALSSAIDKVARDLANLDTEGKSYRMALSTEDQKTYTLTLYETEGGVESVNSQFVLPATGGGGGSSTTTTMTVDRITESPIICTPTDKVIIEVDYSSVDSDGEQVDGTYSIRRGSNVVMSGTVNQGRNSFDVTDYCSVGTQKFSLTITDEGGSVNMKSWTVQVADVRIESGFNDRYTYPVGSSVNFTYTPYGSVPKTVHFKFDGIEQTPQTTTASGTLQSFTIPPQTHGAHLLECWITATINNRTIETDHIFKDIIWFDEDSTVPVIGCAYRYDHYGEVTAKQYATTAIPYVVYDPKTSSPSVQLSIDGEPFNTLRLNNPANTWAYKSETAEPHVLTITCGVTSVEIHMDIEELGYDIEPVTANLEFDFNPVGRSNTGANRLWEDENHPEVKMTVSDNFDWDNGGYQLDENGNQYFCVKAGTRAQISYNLFEKDPKQAGAEFKLIFKTANVRDNTTTWLSCLPEDETKVGLQMDAHEALIYTSTDSLFMPYSEEDIIEFEYNINPLDLEDASATSYIMTYEDGVGARPLIFNDTQRLYQYSPAPITIGSDDCDVHIYRMKAYSSSLSDSNVLANFIADALDSETMIARYERNQIYDENNDLTPESVAIACPDLKVIKIECPHFTNDKKDYVKNTSVECIHKNGDPALDNWKFVNGYHAGQGTTSNEYGYAGRNIDIIFGFDGKHQVTSKIPLDPTYITELTLGDGTRILDGSGKVALKRTSVPNNWFNIKVNIASSENANNALLQKRYNDYLPYKTPGMKRDEKIKNSMEFENCVIFIKESDPDVSTHREFQDTGWHFYGIGNLGDSKKTDNTRVNDPTDLKEFVVEVSDNTLPNSIFPTGVYKDADGNITYDPDQGVEMVYPITKAQWENEANLKRKSLYEEWDETFEFRYDMGTKDGETISDDEIDAQQERSKQVWRDMYEWVITSTDAEFVSQLGNWFIVESPLYWYLFTERYTMIDNRAKNSFWHYGRTYITAAQAEEMGDDAQYYTIDDAAAAINDGYRFDLWDYDNDTALGINNSGELTMTYGHEDIDYKTDGVPSSGFIFNAAESVFWRRIRKLMYSQLQAMYLSRESLNCWSASSLIAEFDAWQEEFPEELWRLDIERKYLRTYKGGTVRFLNEMMNGRKRYQRRQFERDQEAYIGTKYIGTNVTADQIMFRCNTPQSGVVVPPDYTLRIIPYSDQYLTVRYGNSPTPKQIRAKAGQEYEITTSLTEMDDTAILIYCASRIQALNDLSACYIHDNDFSKASKLKTLIIGSTVEGYENPFLTTLNMGNNTLLETLDVRNCPNLAGSINLSACINLENLYAEGTAISSATFARNGKAKKAHFPATVSTLSFLNLNYLKDLVIAGYANLETLICEYSDIDAYGLLTIAIDTLQTVRILGIDWQLADTTVLNKILAMNSSMLSGKVYVSGSIRNQEIANYADAWPDLTVDYDENNLITQFKVTYVNADADHTTLYTTYVDQGELPPDPYALGLIKKPELEATEEFTFDFGQEEDGEYVVGSGWDDLSTRIIANKTITAVYQKTERTYTISFWSRVGVLSERVTDQPYGSEVIPTKRPTWTDGEASNIYHVFKQWDKSTGFIRGDMDVYAVWETASTFPAVGTQLEDMSVSEIYGIAQAGLQDMFWEDGDHIDITLGHDYDFSNVEAIEFGKDVELTGIDRDKFVSGGYYFDGTKGFTTDIRLFDEDSPAFTIAIDYQLNGSTSGETLISTNEGNTAEGFRLYYNGSVPVIQWGDQQVEVGYQKYREMVVLRHPKDSKYLYIYTAGENRTDRFVEEITRTTLLRSNATLTSEPLTFGARRYSSGLRDYGKGTLHWCKIWLDDLGDDVARKIAVWPREKIRMDYWGKNKYYLQDSNVPCGASFYSNSQLGGLKGRGIRHQATSTNAGGWDASLIRDFCNGRLFDAFPEEWQSIIKPVEIRATAGSRSTEIKTDYDKVYLQSYKEMGATTTDAGYIEEVGTSISPISWMTTNLNRIKFRGVFRDYDGEATIYESNQEPSALNQSDIAPGSIWINKNNSSNGYIFVPQEWLDQYGFTADIAADPTYAQGGWIMAPWYWLRSPNLGNTSGFWSVNSYGGLNGYYGASYVGGLVPGFSI